MLTVVDRSAETASFALVDPADAPNAANIHAASTGQADERTAQEVELIQRSREQGYMETTFNTGVPFRDTSDASIRSVGNEPVFMYGPDRLHGMGGGDQGAAAVVLARQTSGV